MAKTPKAPSGPGKSNAVPPRPSIRASDYLGQPRTGPTPPNRSSGIPSARRVPPVGGPGKR